MIPDNQSELEKNLTTIVLEALLYKLEYDLNIRNSEKSEHAAHTVFGLIDIVTMFRNGDLKVSQVIKQ